LEFGSVAGTGLTIIPGERILCIAAYRLGAWRPNLE
jgi:hypothetical protein